MIKGNKRSVVYHEYVGNWHFLQRLAVWRLVLVLYSAYVNVLPLAIEGWLLQTTAPANWNLSWITALL